MRENVNSILALFAYNIAHIALAAWQTVGIFFTINMIFTIKIVIERKNLS